MAHHVSKASTVTFFFLVFFETDIGREHVRNVLKKLFSNPFFLRNHLQVPMTRNF